MSDPAPSPRLARPDELDAVGELTLRSYRDGGVLSGDEDGYAQVLADASGRAALAQVYVLRGVADELLATVTLAAAGEPYADVATDGELEMRMLAVDPAAQGRGVATSLVAFAVAEARRRGLDALAISVIDRNEAALRLYRRLGFVRRPERDVRYPPDVRLLTLTRSVRPGS